MTEVRRLKFVPPSLPPDEGPGDEAVRGDPDETLPERTGPAILGTPLPVMLVEGPLTERRQINTPFGKAWAEKGCFVAKNEITGEQHVVHGDDFNLHYKAV